MISGLQASELSIGYRVKGQPDRKVAEGLDLSLGKGEFVCLLGPNGTGKSTLIRALAGMEPPLSGTVAIDGAQLSQLTPKERARRISVVLTESLPSGMFTARSLVSLGRHPHTGWTGQLTAKDHERIAWALDAVGATALAERHVGELSDGERQKVMVARALAQEATVMLLDEPTAYLDLPRRVELMRTLRELARREGLSILLSTHDLDLAMRSADTLWVFSEGGRLVSGVPEALALRGDLQAAFASDKLDWDDEHGTFRIHREACVTVALEGEGAPYAWTRRALARIGYGVVEGGSVSAMRIRVESGDLYRWDVFRGDGQRRFDSLEAMIAYLSEFDQGGHGIS